MSKPTPEQIAKLPVWAQEYINSLEWRESLAIRALAEIKEDSKDAPIHAERITDPDDGGLGKSLGLAGVRGVTFYPNTRAEIRFYLPVSYTDGSVLVMASNDSIIIRPQAANSVLLSAGKL